MASDSTDQTGTWPYPLEKDGWVITHNVIRDDMAVFRKAVAAVQSRLQSGAPLHAWEVQGLQLWWENFCHNVHLHHTHEEDIFFPEMQARFTMAPKMSSDHKELLASMDEFGGIISSLSPDDAPDASLAKITKLAEGFPLFEKSMDEHLKEEEDILPTYRKHFSFKDHNGLMEKLLKDMKPMDLGWFMHNMSKDEARAFFKQDGVPFPVVEILILPNKAKFHKKYTTLIQAVTAGTEPAKPSFCSCF